MVGGTISKTSTSTVAVSTTTSLLLSSTMVVPTRQRRTAASASWRYPPSTDVVKCRGGYRRLTPPVLHTSVVTLRRWSRRDLLKQSRRLHLLPTSSARMVLLRRCARLATVVPRKKCGAPLALPSSSPHSVLQLDNLTSKPPLATALRGAQSTNLKFVGNSGKGAPVMARDPGSDAKRRFFTFHGATAELYETPQKPCSQVRFQGCSHLA